MQRTVQLSPDLPGATIGVDRCGIGAVEALIPLASAATFSSSKVY